ncbi:MAG: FAD-dependent oxidoreductase, partial [Desulfobacterales bacterium]|nr:FAD-dependent oxidoreductase [Desulfobacterales bacterium]
EATIYFMDIRAHGKGFDDYVERARFQHGVRYRRSMISQVYLNPENDNLIIETFDHHENRKIEEEYDMVVLSSGLQPSSDFNDLASRLGLAVNAHGFLSVEFDEPGSTSRPGVYVCGAAETPKDIPETVIQAGAAAAEASILIKEARNTEIVVKKPPVETPLDPTPRVGVFVCHCGTNIAGVVNIPHVMDYVKDLPGVAYAGDFMFTCSADTLASLVHQIREHRLNRLVVAACSPKTHEPLFRNALRQAGVNPYLFEMVNIRDQCSWVHGSAPEKATEKSRDLIRAGVARALHLESLEDVSYKVVNEALVIGGGVAGMTAALTMADQGFPVHLVEKSDQLGGFTRNLTATLEGASPRRLVRFLAERTLNHPAI